MVRRTLTFTVASLLLAAAGDRSVADVVFTGTVTPGTPGEVEGFTEVTVGASALDQPSVDPRGSIRVDGGSYFEAGRVLIGNNDFALASMEVTGAQTRVQVNEYATIGERGSGYLSIEDGAWVNVGALGQNVGSILIGRAQGGFDAPSVGAVEVRGESSLLTVGRELIVGEGTSTKLSILDGAVVRVGANFNPGVTIAGRVDVAGDRSELQTNWLSLGFQNQLQTFGPSELRIHDGAIVRSVGQQVGSATVGPQGTIVLDGGVFALPVENMLGTLEGSGTVTQTLDLSPSGKIRVAAGDRLVAERGIDSVGTISVTDGELEVFGLLSNENAGEAVGYVDFLRSDVKLSGGLNNLGRMHVLESQLTIGTGAFQETYQLTDQGGRFEATDSRIELTSRAQTSGSLSLTNSELVINASVGSSLEQRPYRRDPSRIALDNSQITQIGCCGGGIINQGVIEAHSGENRVLTSVQSSGQSVLEIGEDASIEFGFADFDGGILVEAGGSATFAASASSGDLTIVLTEQNLERPSLVAKSNTLNNPRADFSLNGSLLVSAEDLGALQLGQTLWLIEADELDGWFDDYTLPELPGTLEFLPVQTDSSLALRVIDSRFELPGDFNADGFVDAADYTLWRDGLPGGQFELDRLVWRKNFGRRISQRSTTVPELAAFAPAMIACLAALRLRRVAEVG